MMLGEPLLKVYRPRVSAVREQASQPQILDRQDITEGLAFAWRLILLPPCLIVDVE